MFNGDIRIERVENIMAIARNLTLAEMKAVVKQLTELHDDIVLQKDPRWQKECHKSGEVYSNDPNWEKYL